MNVARTALHLLSGTQRCCILKREALSNFLLLFSGTPISAVSKSREGVGTFCVEVGRGGYANTGSP